MSLVVATRNDGKIREIRALLAGCGLEVLGLADFPALPEVVEDGKTFRENALKKAREISRATGSDVLADDSGLEVVALDGAPGVYSARFAGPAAGDRANNLKLLSVLRDVPPPGRQARFCCAMALVTAAGEVHEAFGEVEGEILEAPRGEGGFGYDPLFWVPDFERTMAELTMDEKNRVSHRARALRSILPKLRELEA